jgi:hypothetical protein
MSTLPDHSSLSFLTGSMRRHASGRGDWDMIGALRPTALVWALTDLLVEPMPGEAMIEFYRLRAREAAEKKAAAEAAERTWARHIRKRLLNR